MKANRNTTNLNDALNYMPPNSGSAYAAGMPGMGYNMNEMQDLYMGLIALGRMMRGYLQGGNTGMMSNYKTSGASFNLYGGYKFSRPGGLEKNLGSEYQRAAPQGPLYGTEKKKSDKSDHAYKN